MNLKQLVAAAGLAGLCSPLAALAQHQNGERSPATAEEIQAFVREQATTAVNARDIPRGYYLLDGDMQMPLSFNPNLDAFYFANLWQVNVPYTFDSSVSALLFASTHPVTRRLYSGETGRTSTAPIEAAGHRAAHSSAASSEGSSRIVNPPSCSLVSAKGPSCTRRFPSVSRTVVPVSGGCSGLPPT